MDHSDSEPSDEPHRLDSEGEIESLGTENTLLNEPEETLQDGLQHLEPKPRRSFWFLLLLATPWLGVQAVWSLEFALTGAYLYDVVGLPKSYAILVFLLGPLTGMTVAPLVGALSDNCTSPLGRRRPFLIAGVLIVIGASLMFANSVNISSNKLGASIIAFLSFGILDAFMNVLQGPLRALLADAAHSDQQEISQSFGSLFQGAGAILGFYLVPLLGGIDSMVLIFGVACAALGLFSLPVMLFAGEEVYSPDTPHQIWPIISASFRSLYFGILEMPMDMVKICVVQFFCWITWFSYSTVATFYCIEFIFDGRNITDHNSTEYKNVTNEGTQFSSTVNACLGVVQLVFSLTLPFIIRYIPKKIHCIQTNWLSPSLIAPIKILYVSSLIPFPVVFLLISLIQTHNKILYGSLICMAGIAYSGMNVFPFAIVGRLFGPGSVGTNMGIMNIFLCIPMLIANFMVTGLLSISNENRVMLMAGLSGLLAVISSLFVRVPGDIHPVVEHVD